MLKKGRKLFKTSSTTEINYQPQDFAERLLDLEIKFEEICDMPTIDEIIKLYTVTFT